MTKLLFAERQYFKKMLLFGTISDISCEETGVNFYDGS
jgi:hypothetical protein